MRHDNGRAHGHYKPGSDPRLLQFRLKKQQATQQRNQSKARPRKGKPGKA